MMEEKQKSYFHDPVSGHIELSAFEKEVVDTVEFQRLRFIRQLSLMHYVFPGSFHTRFAHSVGVCHNARLVAEQLFNDDQQDNYCIQVFRLASLLHDVGHGAFSHLLTDIEIEGTSFLPTLANALEQPDLWSFDLITSRDFLVKMLEGYDATGLNKAIEHEVLSVLIVHRIVSNLYYENRQSPWFEEASPTEWAQDISNLLLGIHCPSDAFQKNAKPLLAACTKVIKVNGEMDVASESLDVALSRLVAGVLDTDRMDYLLRDSMFCGVTYGTFDRDGLISSMKLVLHEDQVDVAILAKRANTLDDFLWSRYQMFRQVYCHKTHNAYTLLLKLAFKDLVSSSQLETPRNLSDFLKLTDDLVMSKVFHVAQSAPMESPWIEAFARRRLPQFLGVHEASTNDPVWRKKPREIFAQIEEGKYEGWESDSQFAATTLRTEVVKSGHHATDEAPLPLLIDYDKVQEKWYLKSFLQKSIFFNADLVEEKRLEELRNRLNRKLMFFYRYR